MHVLIVTLISNIGKMAVVFFYKDRMIEERLRWQLVCLPVVSRQGYFIAIGYGIGGPLLVISVLADDSEPVSHRHLYHHCYEASQKAERIHALRQTA